MKFEYSLYLKRNFNLSSFFILCFLFNLLIHQESRASLNLVTDLSTYNIKINTSFKGTHIFLFGAKNTISSTLYIIVRGPEKTFLTSKKEKIGPIWVSTKNIKFFNIPSQYSIYKTPKQFNSFSLMDRNQENVLKKIGINVDQVISDYEINKRELVGYISEYKDALSNYLYDQKFYQKDTKTIELIGNNYLFKAILDFPAHTTTIGNYTIELYLLDEGKLVSSKVIPIVVEREYFSSYIYNSASEYSILYAIFCIIIVILIGWIINRIFWRI